MDIMLINKKNIGYVCILLLIIFLSQSKLFNFLLNTILGRSILILFLLCISYSNKILGIVTVLLIIIILYYILYFSNILFQCIFISTLIFY